MKILISEPLPEVVRQDVTARLSQLGEVWASPDTSEETLAAQVREADIFVVRLAKITAKVIENARKLRVIVRPAVGVDNVDVAAATTAGIPIVYSPGSNSDSTAEHTFALILALAKGIPVGNSAAKEGRWAARGELTSQNRELAGATLGVIGLGPVGRRVAKLGAAFGMRVLAHSQAAQRDEAEETGAQLTDLETLFAQSDYVTIHAALTDRTRGLIGAEALAKMKPSAFLVNTARGPIIDETAVLEALNGGRLAGAALDVFSVEPPDPQHPLLLHPRVLVSPHVAGMSRDSTQRMYDFALEDMDRFLRGEPPIRILNPEALTTSRVKR